MWSSQRRITYTIRYTILLNKSPCGRAASVKCRHFPLNVIVPYLYCPVLYENLGMARREIGGAETKVSTLGPLYPRTSSASPPPPSLFLFLGIPKLHKEEKHIVHMHANIYIVFQCLTVIPRPLTFQNPVSARALQSC